MALTRGPQIGLSAESAAAPLIAGIVLNVRPLGGVCSVGTAIHLVSEEL